MANILIIDDDVQLTHLLAAHFSEAGHQVAVAHRGDEGMTAVLKMDPDIILLDVMLPDVTGFQLCSRLRKTPGTASTPILMMTGVARFPNQQVYALERGANEYILKPFDLINLGETVDRYLGADRPSSPVHGSELIPPPFAEAVEPAPLVSEEPATPPDNLAQLRDFLRNAITNSKFNP